MPDSAVSPREPMLRDAAFLCSVKAWTGDSACFHLWWLGQSGFLLGWNGSFAILDPYLSDSLTTKYAGTSTPHVRLFERVVDPARLDFIDLATSSHAHTDHQDPETLRPLLHANPGMTLVVPAASAEICAARLDIPCSRLTLIDEGQTVQAGAFHITAIASAHETRQYDEQRRCRFLGYVFRFGDWAIYHSGDTVDYPGLTDTLRAFSIDVALLPINGRPADGSVPGNLSALEAARLARDIGARMAIPCHYDMFEFNTAEPSLFREAAAAYGQEHRILGLGEHWDSRDLR